MKERQLIGMVDYIEWIKFQPASKDYLEKGYETPVHEKYGRICNFAKLLNQPLTLGMFVPCDEDGNVYESEPQVLNTFTTGLQKLEYQAAKQRVIFEGFEDYGSDSWLTVDVNQSIGLTINEYMQGRELTLTESTYNKYFK